MSSQGVEVDVHTGDAKDIGTDLLVLKNSEGSHGVGEEIAKELDIGTPRPVWEELPGIGEHEVFDGGHMLSARNVLFIGVVSVREFGYGQIRQFARRSLELAGQEKLNPRHVTLTLHGPGYGLDEREAFESELAGLIDAIQEGTAPVSLQRISFVEIDSKRAERMQETLENFIPGGVIERNQSTPEQARSVGYDSEGKPRVFVAMPFEEDFEDVYYLGVKQAVESADADFLCERIDNESFTGNITEQIKDRIESASLVIADMTDANPNVYLEVGYAWGSNVPTLLLTQDTDHLKFDVQSHKSITYDRTAIRELKDELEETLSELADTNDKFSLD